MQLLTERQKRSLQRAWSRRDAKVGNKFAARKQYLGVRTAELEERTKEAAIRIDKIRAAMFKDIGVLLYVCDSDDTEASAAPGPALTPSEKPRLSKTQMERLVHQALATSEVLQQQRDRDLLQLEHFREAQRAFYAAETADISQQKQADESVWKSLNEASLIRLNNSLLHIAVRVVENEDLDYNPSTILSWVRDFRNLGGHFKRDGRGVREREWILSEEDLQLELLQWLKDQKRVSTKNTRDRVRSTVRACDHD